MDKEKKLIKVYGGGKSLLLSLENTREHWEEEKDKININLKNQIAREAINLIKDGDLIYLDIGTTTKQMIKYLNIYNKNLSIITNGYSIALELIEQDIDVCLLGGKLIPSTHAIVGELSLKFVDNFYFDKAFIGMNNFIDNHFYTTNIEEAILKEKIIQNSKRYFILMDSSKFDKKNKIKVELKGKQTLISDEMPNNFNGEFIKAQYK
ncbi:uncharacterized HTH-type transcriptional regulator FruR-like [Stegodyphus dumicola]|uniref:uncharacterized HTH-type transcriptional regulator FruR-like n=1 Tax=Stegodyphus dumicola TaxID=202533 RepID=UPI0015A87044|nr:uncharacterized HTH-type transcriptional regulator FruR-like [Stegodyphus dumicola]